MSGPRRIDETGKSYGKLTVISGRPFPNGSMHWLCHCECGADVLVPGTKLRSGLVDSCRACRDRSLTHGDTCNRSTTKEWRCWRSIKQRCYDTSQDNYHKYGGRGISMCDRWYGSYENFLADMGRAPSPSHSIDRMDFDGDYEPGNCRWATSKEQAANRRKPMRTKSRQG